jgi:hypothetical protein
MILPDLNVIIHAYKTRRCSRKGSSSGRVASVRISRAAAETAGSPVAQDGILTGEVICGVNDGELVEDYPKGPCVLVLQRDRAGEPIRVVWGIPGTRTRRTRDRLQIHEMDTRGAAKQRPENSADSTSATVAVTPAEE